MFRSLAASVVPLFGQNDHRRTSSRLRFLSARAREKVVERAPQRAPDAPPVTLWAWVGHSGHRQTTRFETLGFLPLVDLERGKVDRGAIERQLQTEADRAGTPIRLVECVEVSVVRVIHPRA